MAKDVAKDVAKIGGGAAVAGAATTGAGWLATLSKLAARLGVVGTVLSLGGDSVKSSSPSDIEESASAAAKNPNLRRAFMKMSVLGDDRATQVLEAMHAQLVEQTKLMHGTAAVLVPAQTGD